VSKDQNIVTSEYKPHFSFLTLWHCDTSERSERWHFDTSCYSWPI